MINKVSDKIPAASRRVCACLFWHEVCLCVVNDVVIVTGFAQRIFTGGHNKNKNKTSKMKKYNNSLWLAIGSKYCILSGL